MKKRKRKQREIRKGGERKIRSGDNKAKTDKQLEEVDKRDRESLRENEGQRYGERD